MKKLKLQLEDLRIDSFQTTPVGKRKGTIVGKEASIVVTCESNCPTCEGTCYETCPPSCGSYCETCDREACGDAVTGWFSCLDTCTQTLPTHNDGINCI